MKEEVKVLLVFLLFHTQTLKLLQLNSTVEQHGQRAQQLEIFKTKLNVELAGLLVVLKQLLIVSVFIQMQLTLQMPLTLFLSKILLLVAQIMDVKVEKPWTPGNGSRLLVL